MSFQSSAVQNNEFILWKGRNKLKGKKQNKWEMGMDTKQCEKALTLRNYPGFHFVKIISSCYRHSRSQADNFPKQCSLYQSMLFPLLPTCQHFKHHQHRGYLNEMAKAAWSDSLQRTIYAPLYGILLSISSAWDRSIFLWNQLQEKESPDKLVIKYRGWQTWKLKIWEYYNYLK